MAALAVNQPAEAREIFEQALDVCPRDQNHFAEKITLERLGIASGKWATHSGPSPSLRQALPLARRSAIGSNEANLLWYQGIQHAELGQRDLAIAKAEEAITLFKFMGKPQAGWYGAHLQKYRMGAVRGVVQAGRPRGRRPTLAARLPGRVDRRERHGGPTERRTSGPRQTEGPGLLRMAMSATKAMANFVGSGFKTVPPEIQRKRLETCAACEHHTGLRCKICGCFTNVKSGMLHEDCPIGKWPA